MKKISVLAAESVPGGQPDFRLLFESAPGMLLVVDHRLRFIAASDAYLELISTPREDLIGRDLLEINFPDADSSGNLVSSLKNLCQRVLQSRRVDASVQKYRLPDNEGWEPVERCLKAVVSPVLLRRFCLEFSSPFLPLSRLARGRAWAWQQSSGLSNKAMGIPRFQALRGKEPLSESTFPRRV